MTLAVLASPVVPVAPAGVPVPPRRALVLDEDPVVAAAVQTVLPGLGWSVEALGGDLGAALDAVSGPADRYAVVVLDRHLRGGLAEDLARMLPLLQPGAHVVMLSDGPPAARPAGVSCLLPRSLGLGLLLDHLAQLDRCAQLDSRGAQLDPRGQLDPQAQRDDRPAR